MNTNTGTGNHTDTESAFLGDIAAAGARNDTGEASVLRAIFADWLEERGRETEADAIRLALQSTPDASSANLASGWPSTADMDTLSEHQRVELARATIRPFGMLVGGPGTGKTRCLSALVSALVKRGSRVRVASPTGKAAVRCTQVLREAGVGSVQPSTIHQLLEVSRSGRDGRGWGFQRNASNPLAETFLILDECSMMDTGLAASLLAATRPGHHVLMVGDIGQLPPVGHGSPLRDMLAAGLPTGYLTEIRRNAGMIVEACDAIRHRRSFQTCVKYDRTSGLNLLHIEAATPGEQIGRLGELLARMKTSGSFDVRDDVQVLTATNDAAKSPLARNALNPKLQDMLNPPVTPQGHTAPSIGGYRLGDKVICLRNHWLPGGEYLANGDIGIVTHLDRPAKLVDVAFANPTREATLAFNTKENAEEASRDYSLAWAITVHRSQGSEWRCVVVMVDTSPAGQRVASREFWYTAVSRARELTVTIGRANAMQWQAKRPRLDKRKTFLTDLLTGRAST